MVRDARFRAACALGGLAVAASWATPFAEVIGTTTIRHFSTTVWLIQSTRPSSLAVLAAGVALVATAWLARSDATPLAAMLAFTATLVALWLAASASGSFTSSPVENPVEGRLLEPGFDALDEHFRSEEADNVIYAHARPLVGFWLLLVPTVILLPWTGFRLARAVIRKRVVALLVAVVFSSVAFFLALSWFYLTKLG